MAYSALSLEHIDIFNSILVTLGNGEDESDDEDEDEEEEEEEGSDPVVDIVAIVRGVEASDLRLRQQSDRVMAWDNCVDDKSS